jgi:two-component system, OmpR family, response regulator
LKSPIIAPLIHAPNLDHAQLRAALLSGEHLLNATRAQEDIFDRSIDVQVLRLRRKLEIDASSPRVICTLRGVGYMFALPVEPI